jgi:hypothetical protein
MSEFLKPQNPLRKGEAYIYPLTTVDQVILEDNSRLNFALEHMVYASEEHQESAVTPLDADTLEGYSVNSLIEKIYPVGSIYMSINSTSPATLFGGTWEQIKDAFLLSAGDTYVAGTTGGEATHTLTKNEMPSHNHSPSNRDSAGSDTTYKRQFTTNLHTGSASVARSQVAKSSDSGIYAMTATTYGDITGDDYTSNTGGSQPHNNMPPYLAVYVWKRTV